MATKFSDFILEKDAMTDKFKTAIATLYQAQLGKVTPADYASAIKTVIDAGDMQAISTAIIDSVREKISAQAQSIGISAEATPAPVEEAPAEVPTEPTAEEQAAHEASESPAEEAAEHAPGGSEVGTEEAEGEVKAESYLMNMANYFVESM